jgi:Replication-relaxation
MMSSAQVFPRKPQVMRESRAIGKPHDRILRALGRLHFLTAKQLTRLLYTPSQLRDVQGYADELEEAGYVIALTGYTQSVGRPPNIYTLDRLGREYVAALGIWVPSRFRPKELRELRPAHYDHTLALNDVLISLELLSGSQPHLVIDALRHEQRLKREKVTVRLPDGRLRGAEPDAWVDLKYYRPGQKPLRQCLVIELDRGSEEQEQWREKIRILLAYSDGPYQEVFKTKYLTFAVIAADPKDSERRRDQLMVWTDTELAHLGRMDDADLFYFTATDAVSASPATMWLAPSWRSLAEPEAVPLVALLEGGA